MIAPPAADEPSVRIQKLGGENDWRIWEGYLRASGILLQECMKSEREADSLIFPALFNLRHAIEVALKYHIRYAGGMVPKKGEHDIRVLVEVFRRTADALDEEVSYVSDDSLEFLSELASLDPRSVAFLYSSNLDGTPVEIESTTIGLRRLYFMVDILEIYFDHLAGYIALSRDEKYLASLSGWVNPTGE